MIFFENNVSSVFFSSYIYRRPERGIAAGAAGGDSGYLPLPEDAAKLRFFLHLQSDRQYVFPIVLSKKTIAKLAGTNDL